MSKAQTYFGTDGVRGRANVGKLTAARLLELGRASGIYLQENVKDTPTVVIGWDTRASGDMIRAALAAGLTSTGVNIRECGVIPTPGVAEQTRQSGADLGMMITASHNPHHDNGVKLFNARGEKLEDSGQSRIEAILRDIGSISADGAEHVGRVSEFTGALDGYADSLLSSLPQGFNLNGLKLVVDCANGAASILGPDLFARLKPESLDFIGTSPTGLNINFNCGSTHPETLCETVRDRGADIGLAFDGDADRLLMCDEKGNLIDGDQLLAFLARGWQETGRLRKPGLVATVMSNLGLERYLAAKDMQLVRTPVGDRHVAAKMRSDGFNLGGEQSGHILMTDFGPSGDGVLAALHVLVEYKRLGRAASEAMQVFETVPQHLINVRYNGTSPLSDPIFQAALENANFEMGKSGRILVRASGTEPVIRVMAEGDDAVRVRIITERLAEVIGSSGGGAS